MFLERILPVKREEVEHLRSRRPVRELKAQAKDALPARDFYGAVKRSEAGGRINLIAEIKKASPSRGLIRQDFDPAAIARAYERGGAQAISVLTDEVFFLGNPDYLRLAREAARLPVLRKDFIIDEYQVYESRLLGADAILLITAILAPSQLEDYLGLAGELGLCTLVEVHTAAEAILATAGRPTQRVPGTRRSRRRVPAEAGAGRLIGINNRDLTTFKIDLATTFDLLPLIPPGTTVVSESGISTREQVVSLGEAGVDAVLVGEALMEHDDIVAVVQALLGGETANGVC